MEKVIEPISTILLQKKFRPFFASHVAQKMAKNTVFFWNYSKNHILDAKDYRRDKKALYLLAKNVLYTNSTRI